VDPETGHYYDDTKRYIDGSSLSAADKQKIFEGNIRRVFPRMGTKLGAAPISQQKGSVIG
jgi:4-oxalmesaconate hydratase